MTIENINSNRMKVSNRKLVLNSISNNCLSRADLARETGLTRAAISIIVDNLINDGLVHEGETIDAKLGRKGKAIRLNLDNNYAIGLSLYRDSISVGSVDLEGNVSGYRRFDNDGSETREQILDKVVPVIKEIMAGQKDKEFLGLGIAAPGPIWQEMGIILSPPNFNKWHNFNIVKYFKDIFGEKVYLENMSNALALAENYFGLGLKYDSFAEIVIEGGIGSGIILRGGLYRGANGLGNEIGHMTVNINGELCECGNRGCAEMYASDTAIVSYAKTKDVSLDDWSKIVDGAEKGDIICSSILEREAEYLSTLVINVINVFDLSAVVFAGRITYKFDIIKELIKKNVNARVLARNIAKIDVLETSITDKRDVLSPATTVLSEFFNVKMR